MNELGRLIERLGEKFEPPSDSFNRLLRYRQKRQRRRYVVGLAFAVLVASAGTFSGAQAFNGSTGKTHFGASNAALSQPLCPTPTPVVNGKAVSGPSRLNFYEVALSPAAGPAGSTVAVSARIPFLGPGGAYEPNTTTVEVWWNLDFSAWWSAFSPSPTPAVPGSPVVFLGKEDVTRLCSLQVHVQVPSVPPGTYPIVVLYGSAVGTTASDAPARFAGATSYGPVSFDVTSGPAATTTTPAATTTSTG